MAADHNSYPAPFHKETTLSLVSFHIFTPVHHHSYPMQHHIQDTPSLFWPMKQQEDEMMEGRKAITDSGTKCNCLVLAQWLKWSAWDMQVLSSNPAWLLNEYQLGLTQPVILPRSAK